VLVYVQGSLKFSDKPQLQPAEMWYFGRMWQSSGDHCSTPCYFNNGFFATGLGALPPQCLK